MITQATPTFWQKLSELDFLKPKQIDTWKALAQESESNWDILCEAITAETVLHKAHLVALSNPDGKRVVWGNYLLLRPDYHPLGWKAYQAVHAKLHRHFRLIFLPDEKNSTPPIPGVDWISRSKSIAAISSNEVVKVIDIEVFDDVTIAITQFPEGERLSQLLETPLTPAQILECVRSLAGDLTLMHQSGVSYGLMDPGTIQVDPKSYRCRLDYLISGLLLGPKTQVPDSLPATEQRMIQAYRSAAPPQESGNRTPAEDWQGLGTLLKFLSLRQPSDNSLVKELNDLGTRLENRVNNPVVEIHQWLSRQEPMAQVQPPTTVPAVTLPQQPAVSPSPKKDAPKAAPKLTVAQRKQVAEQEQKRQRLTSIIAMLAPLPLVLLAGLLYYFVFQDTGALPEQLSHQGPVEELPSRFGPEDTQSAADAGLGVADDTVDESSTDGRDQQTDPEDHDRPSDDRSTEEPPAEDEPEAEDERKTDRMKGAGEDDAAGSSQGDSESTPGGSNAAFDSAMTATSASDFPPELPKPKIGEGAPASTNDSMGSENAAEPEASTKTVTVSFENLLDRIDVGGTFSERLKDVSDAQPAASIAYHCGEISWDTAQRMQVSLKAAEASNWKVEGPTVSEDAMTWTIGQQQTDQPLEERAYLRLSREEKLQLEIPVDSNEQLGQLIRFPLLFGMPADPAMQHQLSLLVPRVITPLAFNRGLIRPVSWETPSLSKDHGFLKLRIGDYPFQPLPVESDLHKSLNLRRGETYFYMGDEPQAGEMGLVVRFQPGKTTKFQATAVIATPQGFEKFDEPDKAAAIAETITAQKVQWAQLEEQIRSVRAKPGEGAAKEKRLTELEYLQKDAEEFLESMELLLEKGSSLYQRGLDVELYLGPDSNGLLLLKSGTVEETSEAGKPLEKLPEFELQQD